MKTCLRFGALTIFTISIVFLGNCRKSEKVEAGPFEGLEKKFFLELTNPLQGELVNHAVVLRVADILNEVLDFNPLNCGLSTTKGQTIPFQADDLDGDGHADELTFINTLPPGPTEYIVHYSPTGSRPSNFPAQTYARLAWETADANIGWESNRAAYRFYWGQLEAFGKLDERLIMASFTADYGYHELQDWGMDILHVGNASGLGGISLWEGENRISTINPAGEGPNQYARRIIGAGPVRSIARVDITNIGPAQATYTVTLIMSAFADNVYSRQDILINSSLGGQVVYSPGIEKLPGETWSMDKDSGYLATWGEGAPGAGGVGLGLIFDPHEYVGFAESDLDRYVKLAVPSGEKRTHWIYGGWSRGLTAPVPPQAENWAKDVKELSLRLRVPLNPRFRKR